MTTFQDFGMKPQLQKAIDALGYTIPTKIQIDVWQAARDGSNIVGQSQTGTGKTTAFLLPLLEAIDSKDRFPQVLIVAPTRELVTQIRDDIVKLTQALPIRSLCLMGGRRIDYQREDLRFGPQFIVATPGRLIEFMQEGYLDTSKITHFVLDEVDRMLDMGFIEDVDRIWSQLTGIKQTMTFSATINNEIKNVLQKHCGEYVHIRIGDTLTVDKIDHTYIDMAHEHKFANLINLIEIHKGQKIIIFAQTKRNTEVINDALFDKWYEIMYLNGDLDQRQRTRALRAFKEGTCKILVTTDVAARWLNMDNVELVVNFDVPREPESYIHRIGRTGRAGAEGKALMLVSPDEKHLLFDIEKSQKIVVKKSTTEAVRDEKGEFRDVYLDRPLPPSAKKKRAMQMVERRGGISGQRRSTSGWYAGRSSAGSSGWYAGRSSGGYAGRSESSSSRGGFSSSRSSGSTGYAGRTSGGYAGRSEGTSRSEAPRSDAPRTFDKPERNTGPRSFDRPRAPRESDIGVPGRSSDMKKRSFGGNERRSAPRTGGAREWGFSRTSTPRSWAARSIGGYDTEFVTAQRTLDRDRFAPRGPRPTTGANDRGGARFAPRWSRPSGDRGHNTNDRPAKPRLSSKPIA